MTRKPTDNYDYGDFDFEDYLSATAMGVPDWEARWKREDYQKLTWWQIAWGFLRHLNEYQADWLYWGDRFSLTSADYRPLCASYGLARPVDPGASPFSLADNPFPTRQLIVLGPTIESVVVASHEALLRIDLSQPIESQLRKLKHQLASKSRTKNRLRLDLSKALCLLDAEASGATYASIARVLYAEEEVHEQRGKLKNLRGSTSAFQARRGYVDLSSRRDR